MSGRGCHAEEQLAENKGVRGTNWEIHAHDQGLEKKPGWYPLAIQP